MRSIHIIPLVLAFAAAQMVPLAPAHAATTIKSGKSKPWCCERVSKPPAHHKPATTVKGSKSNSSD